jgi:Tol biopolymer transport system component
MSRSEVGCDQRGRFRVPGITGVAAVCLTLANPGVPALGDDPKKGDDKPRSDRIIVYAFEDSPEVPAKQRFSGVLSVDLETGEWKQVGDADTPRGARSPDGRFVAANGGKQGTSNEGVWVHDLEKKTPPRKVFDRFGLSSWSGDGRQLIIAHPVAGGRYETYRVNADGTGMTRLPIPETDLVEDYSREGSWLAAFEAPAGRNGPTRIHLMRPDGTERHTVVNEEGMPHSDYQLSPDGRKLVYEKITIEPLTFKCALWVVDSGGENRTQIPLDFEPGTTARVRWSPDGTRLALTLTPNPTRMNPRAKEAKDRLVVVGLDGKNLRTIPLPPWRLVLLGWE